MATTEEARACLAGIPDLSVSTGAPLSRYTRFGIGGPADLYAETGDVEAFIAALAAARASGIPTVVIGGGTNLVVSDRGFRGIVLRYRGDRLMAAGERVIADAGAVLQDLVDFTIERGLQGLETLAGIPGSVGAAVYGNAGAYGHSLSERVIGVRFHDGREIRAFTNEECRFHYRESIFKRHKDWIVFSIELLLEPADPARLRETAAGILKVRNEKFPVTMKCAGSIFKNLLLRDLPPAVAAEVPPARCARARSPPPGFWSRWAPRGAGAATFTWPPITPT